MGGYQAITDLSVPGWLLAVAAAGALLLAVALIVGIRALAALSVKSWGEAPQSRRNESEEVDRRPTLHP
jgi:hypothetical protein